MANFVRPHSQTGDLLCLLPLKTAACHISLRTRCLLLIGHDVSGCFAATQIFHQVNRLRKTVVKSVNYDTEIKPEKSKVDYVFQGLSEIPFARLQYCGTTLTHSLSWSGRFSGEVRARYPSERHHRGHIRQQPTALIVAHRLKASEAADDCTCTKVHLFSLFGDRCGLSVSRRGLWKVFTWLALTRKAWPCLTAAVLWMSVWVDTGRKAP